MSSNPIRSKGDDAVSYFSSHAVVRGSWLLLSFLRIAAASAVLDPDFHTAFARFTIVLMPWINSVGLLSYLCVITEASSAIGNNVITIKTHT